MQVKHTRSRRGVAASLLPITLALAMIVGGYQGASGGQTTGVQTTGAPPTTTTGTGTGTGTTGTTTGTTAQTTGTPPPTTTGAPPTTTGAPPTTTGTPPTTTTAQTTGTTGQTTTAQTTGTPPTTTTTGTTGQTTTGQTETTGTTGQTTTAQTTGTTTATTTATATTGATTAQTTGTTTPTTGGQVGLFTGGVAGGITPATADAVALPTFGYAYFMEARQMVEARRRALATGTPQLDPLKGPVGPEGFTLGNVSIPIPERYQLGPGDSLRITWSSPLQAAQNAEVKVDTQGYIVVPGTAGQRMVVRGQTLAQISDTLQRTIRGYLRDASVTVQLGELRTMTIRVLGEVFAPGTYEVPSIITLFNALYAAGGPTENGTFRRIQLKRSNGVTKTIDLYRMLALGDASQDAPLQPGDMILIPPAEKRIAVKGEVVRQAVFELIGTERLQEAMKFAGGVRPSGVTQRVLVESIRPGVERRLIDVNLKNRGASDNPPLFDGDVIEVFSIRPTITNAVSIDGMVDQPRTYAFNRGMTVADLVEMARGVLPNAYLDKADLFRMNADGSKTLISIRLRDALKRTPVANVELHANDRLVVYDVNQVQFMGERRIQLNGQVNRPGQYYRADNMTVRDVIIQAGGLLPDAYTQMAMVQRLNKDGTPGPLVRINLSNALAGLASDNIRLDDRDEITIYSIQQAQFMLQQTVEIRGAVQRPSNYVRATNMRLADLVALAGGPLPDTFMSKAFLQRTNPDGTPGEILTVDLAKVMAGDASANILLQPKDQLTVFTIAEATFLSQQTVEIKGAVQRPGVFARNSNMRLMDLFALAGGPLPTTYMGKAFLQRTNLDGTPGPLITIDLSRMIAGDPTQNILLEPKDSLQVYSNAEATYLQTQNVEITGAVQRQGTFVRAVNMRVADLISLAGGTLPDAFLQRAFLQRTNLDGTPGPLITIDVAKAMADDPAHNLLLEAKDHLTIYSQAQAQFIPDQQVEISGAVQRPGSFRKAAGMRVADLLGLAGDALPIANRKRAFLQRINENGTQGPLVVIDLDKALAGDPANNVELQVRDKLSVFTLEQSAFRVEQTVRIEGALQRPGVFPSSSNLTLKSLIEIAGGVLPNASDTFEIHHAWSPVGTPVTRVRVTDALAGAEVKLSAGDTITLPVRKDLLPKPMVVSVFGEVRFPGPYMITGANDRISDLIKRAGGLTTEAYINAAEFVRDPKLLSTANQVGVRPDVVALLQQIAADDYARATALSDMDRLRIVFSGGASISSSTSLIPGLGGSAAPAGSSISPGISMDQAIAQSLRAEAVTKARALGEKQLIPSGNLNVNMVGALQRPGSRDDLTLRDGDVVVIPVRPTTVAVSGAVIKATSVLFAGGQGLDYYVNMAGGLTADAATDTILIVRANGALVRYRRGVRVEVGDNIIIPTKVMAVRLTQKVGDLEKITNTVSSAAITVSLIKALIGK